MIKKFYKWCLAHVDKLLHFGVNYAVVISGAIFGATACFITLGVMILASFGKEALDQRSYGGWSWGDLLADGIGILLAILVAFLGGVL